MNYSAPGSSVHTDFPGKKTGVGGHAYSMLKILQARLQQYVNRELPNDQAGFRKGRETRD